MSHRACHEKDGGVDVLSRENCVCIGLEEGKSLMCLRKQVTDGQQGQRTELEEKK